MKFAYVYVDQDDVLHALVQWSGPDHSDFVEVYTVCDFAKLRARHVLRPRVRDAEESEVVTCVACLGSAEACARQIKGLPR